MLLNFKNGEFLFKNGKFKRKFWTPLEIETYIWHNSTRLDSIYTAQANSADISMWKDVSTYKSSHLVQSTASSQPVFNKYQLNGLPVMSFLNDTTYLEAEDISIPSNEFYYAIVTMPLYAVNENYRCSVASLDGDDIYWRFISRHNEYYNWSGGFDVDGPVTDKVYAYNLNNKINQWHIYGFQSTTTESSSHLDGTTTDTGGGITDWETSDLDYHLGVYKRSGTLRFENCHIAEAVMCEVGYREYVEGYLAWKWGLDDLLPSTHPYKYNAP